MKKNVPNKRGKPKKVILKARQITVSRGLTKQNTLDHKGVVDVDPDRDLYNPGFLDFDANVGICFLK